MAVPEVSTSTSVVHVSGAVSLERQLEREHSILRAGMWGILIALPLTVALTIIMMAIAISDKEPWYVWIGLSVVIGGYAALFFGSITAIQLTAHRLDHAESEAEADDHDVTTGPEVPASSPA